MKKSRSCLYIGAAINSDFGGGIVTNNNKRILQEIFGGNLICVELPHNVSRRQELCNMLSGKISGLNQNIYRRIKDILKKVSPDFVFVNSSTNGILYPMIKKLCPTIKIVTFFHNVETKFVWDGLRVKKFIGNILLLGLTYYSEYLVIKYSDIIVTLNYRDSKQLKKLYGRAADYIIPISFPDRFEESRLHPLHSHRPRGVFIGSLFYANLEGMRWFARKVSKHVNADILIVGKNFESVRDEFLPYHNIKVIGSVPDVSEYFYEADFVIFPLFSGSGMKVKTAEALMYGKTIFGTPEAFAGYNIESDKVGKICKTAEDFIYSINNYKPLQYYNEYSRQCFLDNYLIEKTEKAFHEIFT